MQTGLLHLERLETQFYGIKRRISGKSNSTVEIEFDGNEQLIGQYVNVRIDRFTNVLEGTIV